MNTHSNAVEFLEFEGVRLNVSWLPASSRSPDLLPDKPGLYAEIYWPERGVRIGETGRSIRGKIRHDIRWFKSMHAGTAPPEQLRRTLPIAIAAKKSGVEGFGFYPISTDPRLVDKDLRQDAERFLFSWVRAQQHLMDWNRQVSWR